MPFFKMYRVWLWSFFLIIESDDTGSYGFEHVRTTKAELHDELSLSKDMFSFEDISGVLMGKEAKSSSGNLWRAKQRFLQSQSTKGELEFRSHQGEGIGKHRRLTGISGRPCVRSKDNKRVWTLPERYLCLASEMIAHLYPPPPPHTQSISLLEETVTLLDGDDITWCFS